MLNGPVMAEGLDQQTLIHGNIFYKKIKFSVLILSYSINV